MLSVDSASQPAKSPSMPVPSVPRRAAPPRKKAIKSPSPAPTTTIPDIPKEGTDNTEERAKEEVEADVPSQTPTHVQDKEPAADEQTHEAEADQPTSDAPMLSGGDIVLESPAQIAETGDQPNEQEEPRDHGTREPEMFIGEPTATHHTPDVPAQHQEADTSSDGDSPTKEKGIASALEPELAEEEEEAARRKRIAEKMSKMGGVNPLAPRPPVVSPSDDSMEDAGVLDPEHPERTDVILPPIKQASEDTKLSNVDSSSMRAPLAATIPPLASSKINAPIRKDSAQSVGHDYQAEEDNEDGKY